MVGGTAQGAVGLGKEGVSGNAAPLSWTRPLGWAVGHGPRRIEDRQRRGWPCRAEFGQAERRGLKRRPQFQTQVPDPLAENLPAFLSPRRVFSPAVWILCLVLIGQDGLESAPLHLESHPIGAGEPARWQAGTEQFIPDPGAGHAEGTGRGRRGRHKDPAGLSRRR
jgi:hypothetical protein